MPGAFVLRLAQGEGGASILLRGVHGRLPTGNSKTGAGYTQLALVAWPIARSLNRTISVQCSNLRAAPPREC